MEKLKKFLQDIQALPKEKMIFHFLITFLISLSTYSIMALSHRYPLNFVTIGIYGVLIFTILFFVLKYGFIKFDLFFLLLSFFDIFLLISACLSGFRNFTFSAILMTITAFFLYQYYINCKEFRHILFALLVGSIGFVFHFSIVYFKDIISFNLEIRSGSFFANLNDTGKYLLIPFIIFSFFVLVRKKVWLLPFAIYIFYLVIMTGSRSNLVTGAIVFLSFIYIIIPSKRKFLFFLFLGLFSVFSLLILQLPSLAILKTRILSMLQVLFTFGQSSADSSTAIRFKLLQESILMFLKRPVFGYGFGGVADYSFNGQFSHNNIFEIGANHGIFALVCFETLLLYPLKALFNRIKKVSFKNCETLLLALLLNIFIFQFFLVTYASKIEYFIFPIVYRVLYNKNDMGLFVIVKAKKLIVERTSNENS